MIPVDSSRFSRSWIGVVDNRTLFASSRTDSFPSACSRFRIWISMASNSKTPEASCSFFMVTRAKKMTNVIKTSKLNNKCHKITFSVEQPADPATLHQRTTQLPKRLQYANYDLHFILHTTPAHHPLAGL